MYSWSGVDVNKAYGTLCNCCGATYTSFENHINFYKSLASAGPGITMLAGLYGSPEKWDTGAIDHIKTKDGDFTLLTRFKKDAARTGS